MSAKLRFDCTCWVLKAWLIVAVMYTTKAVEKLKPEKI